MVLYQGLPLQISVNDGSGQSPENWLRQSGRGRTDPTDRHKILWRRNSRTGPDYIENTNLGKIYNANQFNPITHAGSQICPSLHD